MIPTGMQTTIEPVDGGEKGASEEGEPSRTCADISIEDDRWTSVTGLEDLIPNLAAETLVAAQLSPESHCVSVALLSDSEVRALNRAFRGKDVPTNVLSFPSASAVRAASRKGEPVFLGDVALAYETVMSEAESQGKTVLQHTAHLVAHGILHLAGFDHDGDADAERMETAERIILARFGVPDPYREDSGSPTTAL
jgi:probable rRNA maturation factor